MVILKNNKHCSRDFLINRERRALTMWSRYFNAKSFVSFIIIFKKISQQQWALLNLNCLFQFNKIFKRSGTKISW